MISILNGINSGIINDIPLVKAKCPIAENANMADKAILPESAHSYSPRVIFIVKRDKQNTAIKTINGFIFLSQRSSDLKNETMNLS